MRGRGWSKDEEMEGFLEGFYISRTNPNSHVGSGEFRLAAPRDM